MYPTLLCPTSTLIDTLNKIGKDDSEECIHFLQSAASHIFLVASSLRTLSLLNISFQLLLLNTFRRSQSSPSIPPRDSPTSFTKFQSRPQRASHWHGTHFANRLSISRRLGSIVVILATSRLDSMWSMYNAAITNGLRWILLRTSCLSRRRRVHVSKTWLGDGF